MVKAEIKQSIADATANIGAVTTVTGVAGGGIAAFVHEYYSTFMLSIALCGLLTQMIATYFKVKYMKKNKDETL